MSGPRETAWKLRGLRGGRERHVSYSEWEGNRFTEAAGRPWYLSSVLLGGIGAYEEFCRLRHGQMLRIRISDLPQCLVWKSNTNNRDTAVDVPIPLSPVRFLFSVLHSCSAFPVRLSSVTRKSPCLGSLGSLLTSFFPHLDSYSLKIILLASLVLTSSFR